MHLPYILGYFDIATLHFLYADDIGAPKNYKRSQIYFASGFSFIQFPLGSIGLCTDTTKQEPYTLADWLGSRAARCILAELGHTICFFDHPKTDNIFVSVCLGILLHDSHCFCSIPCKFGGSWKSCSFPQTSNRIVSELKCGFEYIVV